MNRLTNSVLPMNVQNAIKNTICFLTLLFILGCHSHVTQKKEVSFSSGIETIEIQNEQSLSYEKGLINVPMNRKSESLKSIGVEFHRFYKNSDVAADVPPIFILRGGPGYEGAGADLVQPWYFENNIKPYLDFTDVVIVGQRGFGQSFDTSCEDQEKLTGEDVFDHKAQMEVMMKAMQACRIKWQNKGVDLLGFNVIEAAADVNAVAEALGYDQIQLVGNSFGSHWGMTIIKYFPERVARATFGAIEGPNHTYDVPDYTLNTFRRIAAVAESSAELQSLIPKQGIIKAFQELIDEADKKPFKVTYNEPESEQVIKVEIDGDHLRSLIGGYTRSPNFRHRMDHWPMDIIRLINRDFQRGLDHLYRQGSYNKSRSAAFYPYECGSGVSKSRLSKIQQSLSAKTVGEAWKHFYGIPCEVWSADLGEEFRNDFVTDVPTVLIHGSWDIPTPYENALEILPMFKRHKFIHVDQGAHGAVLDAVVESPGFEAHLLKWMKTGQFDHLPERVDFPSLRWKVE